jgi:proteasome lid subunit RPN8/RPN11
MSVVATTNVADGVSRFRINPAEHIALRRSLRADPEGRRIVGVYHSHPLGDAVPSETDIAEAQYPEWVQVIVGLGGARSRVRAFGIADGSAWEIPIRPKD